MSDVILRVDADTRAAEAKIGKLGNKSINLNTKNFNQPLGKITGQLGEFEKSLEASNARVIAFGASAGAIFAVQRALSETIKSAIDVEKSLTDINVILNLSSESLSKFGGSLFDIAKNTGNTFKSVAEAATELSRQGLGVEETLKRTQNALILTRLSGLGAADAVEALTATINGFSKEALNSSEIVNKFAAVDAAFAVSSADLAEAVKRVGSSASEAGVSLDQLIGIVTAAQQITARGGAVIGNSFKTIFTRLQRPKVLEDLEALGIATKDAQGNFLPLIGILQGLARSYDGLNSVQRASIAETVGGVFQINVLKAALSDLGKEYSIYGRALQISNSATDEATSRNEQLNKTFSSLLSKTVANLTQAGAQIGGQAFQPGIEKILNSLNSFLEDFSSKDTESVGAKIAQGIVTGLGSFLSGPGILLAGKALFVIFERLAAFSADALKTILGLNSRAAEQAQIQKQIFDLLSKNPQIIQQINQGTISVEQTQSLILKTIQEQTVAMQQQIGLAKTLASSLSQAGVSMATTGIGKGRIQAKYAGYIPNFANQDQLIENTGAAQHGYKAGRAYRKTLYDGSGGSFPAVVNSAETIKTFKNSIGKKATIVEPPNGFASGYIPNFAKKERTKYKVIRGDKKINPYVAMIYPQKSDSPKDFIGMGIYGDKKVPIRFKGSGYNTKKAVKPEDANLEKQLGENIVRFTNKFISNVFGNQQQQARIKSVNDLANRGSFDSIVGSVFETAVGYATGNLNEGRSQNAPIDFANPNQKLKNLFNFSQSSYQLEAKGNPGKSNADSVAQKILDLGLISGDLKGQLAEKLGKGYQEEVEARRKKTESSYLRRKSEQGPLSSTTSDQYGKMFPWTKGETSERGRFRTLFGSRRNKSLGYIPNFSALQDAISREKAAGINSSLIRVDSASELVSNSNPLGLGVYNTKDEPAGLKQGINRNKFSGYVPNFAKVDQGLSDQEKIRIRAQRNTPAANVASPKLELKLAENAVKTTSSFDELKKGLQEAGKSASNFGKTTAKDAKRLEEFKGRLVFAGIAASQIAGQLRTFGANDPLAKLAADIAEAGSTASTVASILPGKIGIAAGAVLGLGQAINSIATDLQTEGLRKVIKNSEMAAESLSQLSEAGQRYVSSFENLSDAYSGGNPKLIQKAQESFAQSLNDLPEEIRNQFGSAKNLPEAQDLYAQALSEKSKSATGEKVAGTLSQAMMASQGNIYKQMQGVMSDTRSNVGVFTGEQHGRTNKGIELADKIGAQTVQGLNPKFVEDIGKGLVDTKLKGQDFIDMLEKYGLTTDQSAVFTALNNDVLHAGAQNFEILTTSIIGAAISAKETAKKAKETFAQIENSASSMMSDIVNQALAFTSQQNLKELQIGKQKGISSAYKPFMSEETSAQTESNIKLSEMQLEYEKNLAEVKEKYKGSQIELNVEQAKLNQQLQQSNDLEKQRLNYQLQEIKNKKALSSMGGVEGLFSQKSLLEDMSKIDDLGARIKNLKSPEAKAGLQAEQLSLVKKQGGDVSGFDSKEIALNIGKGRQNLYTAKAQQTDNPALKQAYTNLASRAPEETTLQVANLTENFDLVKNSTDIFNSTINQSNDALSIFTKNLTDTNNVIGGLNQRTTNTQNQEFKGTIDVQLSPLVIQLAGNVTSTLDPVNQRIIDAIRETISQLEGKVNSLGLLESKIGPPSK
jgi:TP901 family phage tail tape measure protein